MDTTRSTMLYGPIAALALMGLFVCGSNFGPVEKTAPLAFQEITWTFHVQKTKERKECDSSPSEVELPLSLSV